MEGSESGKAFGVNRKRYPTDLQDSQWAVIEGLMPATATTGRPRKHDYREIVNAIFYVLSNGLKWRALPHDMPPWQRSITTLDAGGYWAIGNSGISA